MKDLSIKGRLTADPEIRNSTSGKAYVVFTLASDYSKKNNDTWETKTTFFNFISHDERIKKFCSTLKKGQKLLVGAKIEKRKVTNKDGKDDYRFYFYPESIDVIAQGTKEAPTETHFNLNEFAITGNIKITERVGPKGPFMAVSVSRYEYKDKDKDTNVYSYFDFTVFNENLKNRISSYMKNGDNVTVTGFVTVNANDANKKVVLNARNVSLNRSFTNEEKVPVVEAIESVTEAAKAEEGNETFGTEELFNNASFEDFGEFSMMDDGDLPF